MPIFTVFGTLPAFLALFLILNRTVFQLKRYLLATVAFTLGIYVKVWAKILVNWLKFIYAMWYNNKKYFLE